MSLPTLYTNAIARLPTVLHDLLNKYCTGFLADTATNAWHDDAEFVQAWVHACATSDFVAQLVTRHAAVVGELHHSGDLRRAYPAGAYAQQAETRLHACANEETLMSALRRWRRREMLRIAWRDLNGSASLDETLRDLSALADAAVAGALQKLYAWRCAIEGVPHNAQGVAQHLVVLGMGKLGAHELNFSSDIDLIFAFPEEGETRGVARSRSNGEFFVKLCQQLVRVLDQNTAEGFVFRVDTRLRPFGDVGQLALSFDALEHYYQTHGREWERYALIKARCIAGDQAQGAVLLKNLQPFVFRRYLDYGAFESLREMKVMIAREVARKGMENNVKLGPGGIREIEFIGQAFQLIRGGREPALRVSAIQPVLRQIGAQGLLPDYVVTQLLAAYEFLRRTENRIQAYEDRQTHMLPDAEQARVRLAWAMGYAQWDTFVTALRAHMHRVHDSFEQVFAAPQAETAAQEGTQEFASLWQGALTSEVEIAQLRARGWQNAEDAEQRIRSLRDSKLVQSLSQRGRDRLDKLMPMVLAAAAQSALPDLACARALTLIETVAKRTAYLALLVEHPMALSQLMKLCAASPWIARLLTRHPLLLDELLDPRALYNPLNEAQLAADLRARLAGIAAEDVEMQMDLLRQFKQGNVLRVAASDVAGATPLMVVSDHLTALADVCLQVVYELAWRDLSARHGAPSCVVAGQAYTPGFAIVGYGKLGGFELGYGSDLDVVFLHDSSGEQQQTGGPAVIDNAVFYARLAQRLVHYLSAHTAGGILYEVDTRLRPSGASGLLVSSVEAYAHYQRHAAWTWEHQALIRARAVGGDTRLTPTFNALRGEIIGRTRDPATLRTEVRDMRERMRKEMDKNPARFDLKHGRGGVVDIEFMVQYWVLREAQRAPQVAHYTDNIRQIEAVAAAGVLDADTATRLADIYRLYRKEIHTLTLQEAAAVVSADQFVEQRKYVGALWRWHMGES
ncbi:MAG: bifunctional [glutamate--ammonia ligase]-adenylyl-L-tyrosine phosphorylase/[glutamate--ammonia-ligase] adenylyltransferase [Pseudomonadota bacterium]